MEVPATVEYKNGQTVWLELPISLVKDRVLLRNKEAEEKAYKLKMKKIRKQEKVRRNGKIRRCRNGILWTRTNI